jgi:hypothetical protein
MAKHIVFIFLMLLPVLLHAQNTGPGIIAGRLLDTANKQRLQGAALSVNNTADTSFAETVLSQKDGSFIIKNIPAGTNTLYASFVGYETIKIRFHVSPDSPSVFLGNIYMKLKSNTLATVTVESPPIIIKTDTVEYNANMYTTKPDANVADLLQKLPGVDVDQNGNIKAQGETVQRVLVNGKRFFGDDPKMATQNLPPDVVDKIQVFDDLSDQSAFTGFDDGTRVKTINIITKKNKSKGYFGKVTVGAGNKGLYEDAVNMSRFDGNQQITVIGQGNNTNQQAFTVQDILGTFNNGSGGGTRGYAGALGNGGGSRGNSASTGGGGGSQGFVQGVSGANSSNNGITTTWAGGLNYRDQWGKKTDAYGSYFYNNLLVTTSQKSTTQNLFPTNDSSTFNNANQLSNSRSINQRLQFNIETTFDSSNSLIVRPNVSYQNTTSNAQSTEDITTDKGAQVSNSVANSNAANKGYTGNIDAVFRHRFKKKGRTFSIDENVSGSSNNGSGNNFSVLTDSAAVDTTNQYYVIKSNSYGFSTTLAYTEPLGTNQMLELTYNNSYTNGTASRSTYNFNDITKEFTDIDTTLTNSFQNTYTSNRVVLNYLIRNQKMNLNFGAGVQYGTLTSLNETKDSTLTHNFTNLYPTINFNYRFTKTKNLRINYSGRTTQPTVQQLEPVTDNSDPLNIKEGNPNLGQEFTNALRLLYTSFDPVTYHNVFASINASVISNDIVNATTILSNGAQIIQPINLNGAYNVSGFFNYGFPLKKPKSNLNFTTNLTYTQNPSLVNDVINYTQNSSFGETLKWTTNLKKDFDMVFSATPTYNIATYSVQPSENANYFSNTLIASPTFYTKSGWILSSTFNFTSYSGRAPGYNTSVPLLNAFVAKQFFKDKSGELKFFVFDLLNQNVSITRNITENYIQDVQTKVLTRYFLVSFIYNLRKFGGQQMPGMFHRNNSDHFMPPDGNMQPPSAPSGTQPSGTPPPPGE